MAELVMKYQQYDEYKDSGVEWLGEIPKDWEVVRLKYIAELSGNKISGSENQYVGLENVESKTGKFKVTEGIVSEGVSNTFEKGNLLFGKLRPYLAKSWLASFSGICSSEFLVLNSQLVHPKFLKYMTLTDEFVEQVNSSTYGTKMPRASWDFIGLLPLPVMNYDLSKIIANFLDYETAQIDTLIHKQQTLIQLLKEKRQAVISHAVTKGLNPDAPMKDSGVEWLGDVPEHWEVCALKHILATPITDGPHETPVFLDEGVPFISAEAVSQGYINFDKKRAHISKLDNEKYSKKYTPKKYDIYIVKSGATTGVSAIVETDREFNIWSPLAVIRCAPYCEPYFTLFAIRSKYFQEEIRLNWNYGTQQNIGMAVLGNLLITYPPRKEAQEISNYLKRVTEKMNELIERAEQAIQLMQERRTALISAAVTGKIDVRGWEKN